MCGYANNFLLEIRKGTRFFFDWFRSILMDFVRTCSLNKLLTVDYRGRNFYCILLSISQVNCPAQTRNQS